MSTRLYVCTVHRIEYGANDFGNKVEFINRVLNEIFNVRYDEYGDEVEDFYGYMSFDGDYLSSSSQLEIQQQGFIELFGMSEKNALKTIEDAINRNKTLCYYGSVPTAKELYDTLKRFYEQADKDDGWIHLHWF